MGASDRIFDPTMITASLSRYPAYQKQDMQLEAECIATLPSAFPQVRHALGRIHGPEYLDWCIKQLVLHSREVQWEWEWDTVVNARKEILNRMGLIRLPMFGTRAEIEACQALSRVVGVSYAADRWAKLSHARNFNLWVAQTMEFGAIFMKKCHSNDSLRKSEIPLNEVTRLLHTLYVKGAEPADSIPMLLRRNTVSPLMADQLYLLSQSIESGVPLEYALEVI